MLSVKQAMFLYAVTDRSWLGDRTLAHDVEESLKGGATCIQLREKNMDTESFLRETAEISALCRRYQVPFLINDNIEVALRSDADGIHVGQHDLPPQEVRKIIGPNKILGVSAQTVEQALEAEANGADYLGVGAMFSTSTKNDADAVSIAVLTDICKAVSIPVVAIGGIHRGNLPELADSGIDGIAVVSAIYAQKDICGATRELADAVRKTLNLS